MWAVGFPGTPPTGAGWSPTLKNANALLALAYTEAFQDTRLPLYEQTVRRTLNYLLRSLPMECMGG